MTTSIQTRKQPFVLGESAGPIAAALMAFVLFAAAAVGLANGVWSTTASTATDASYEAVEGNRVQMDLGAGDGSYDAAEKIRIGVPPAGGHDANPSRGRGLQPS
jgi:hypothetical protein